MLLVYLSIIRSQYRANGRTSDRHYRHAFLSVCPLSVSLSHFVALISMIFASQLNKSLFHSLLTVSLHLYWLEMYVSDISFWFLCLLWSTFFFFLSFKLNLDWDELGMKLCVFVSLLQVSLTFWSATIPPLRSCVIMWSLRSSPCSTLTACTWETTGQLKWTNAPIILFLGDILYDNSHIVSSITNLMVYTSNLNII